MKGCCTDYSSYHKPICDDTKPICDITKPICDDTKPICDDNKPINMYNVKKTGFYRTLIKEKKDLANYFQ